MGRSVLTADDRGDGMIEHRGASCEKYGTKDCPAGLRAGPRSCARCTLYTLGTPQGPVWHPKPDEEKGKPTPRTKIQPIPPIPRDQWPAAARFIARLATPEDKGVGSTIERLLGSAGRLFKAMVARLGKDCGCSRRRDTLDARYPY